MTPMPAPDLPETLNSAGMHWTFVGIGGLLLLTLVREIPRIPARLLVLMAAAFLDMAGLLMIVPLVPFYVQRLANGGDGVLLLGMRLGEGQLTGIVVSAFTLAQLASAPFWGRFSDRRGRRPAMLVALGMSAVSYVVFGFADSLPLLLFSRLLQGLGGGTVGVIQGYVADSTEPAQRARALGWLSAATNLGVALGPVLGSAAVRLGDLEVWAPEHRDTVAHAAPGVLAAALCLLTMAFAARFLRESNESRSPSRNRVPIRSALYTVVQRPLEPASRLILTYAIAIGAFTGTTSQLPLSFKARFGIDQETIGYVFFWIGAVSVFTRVLLLGPLVDRLGEVRLSRIGIVTLIAGLVFVSQAESFPALALSIAMLPLGTAFTFPCVTALLSRVVDQQNRGMFMGLQQTFGGAARIVMPQLCGYALDHVGVSAPFLVSSAFVAATLPLGLGLAAAVAKRAAH
ncbi:MAG: MFS transporter [Planctomycetes bacterium]|nr:MFS transporter [Planctomycetota bacterium]